MEEQTPYETSEPEASGAEPAATDGEAGSPAAAPPEKPDPAGLCDKCNAVVPLTMTFKREDQRWHHPPPAPKGFRKAKGDSVCGPVLTRWRYRIVFALPSGVIRAEHRDLDAPLKNKPVFEAVERIIAAEAGVESVTIVTSLLLAKA